MKLIKNIWIRLILSLVGGGMTNEIVFLCSGDPYRHRSVNEPNFTILYAIIIFLILTAIVNRLGKNRVA